MRITLVGTTLVLAFQPTPRDLARVRSLPARRFDPSSGQWLVPHTRENWAAMRALAFPLDGIEPPTGTGYTVALRRGLLIVKTPWSPKNAETMRSLPDYRGWDAKAQAWYAKPTRRNLEYLRAALTEAKWDEAAEAVWAEHAEAHRVATDALRAAKATELSALEAERADDYKHGGPTPWDHQRRAFLLSRDRPAFALFMEQRTGKTKVFIDTACWNHVRGTIRQALVIAPNSVKANWVTDELPTHMPEYIGWRAAAWKATPRKADKAALDAVLGQEAASSGDMLWLVMNVEAFSTARGAQAALDFVKRAPTIVGVDESTRIKTPRAARTLAVLKLRKHAPLRRLLTGTPATQGPLDLFSQFWFLDPDILGFGNFYGYRNHYAIMGGFNGKVVLGYQKLEELQALIDPHSFRVTRDECFDIPPKGYQKLVVEMSHEQAWLYAGMRDRMRAELGETKVTATLALTQMLRLAQIAGGFLPVMDGENWEKQGTTAIPGPNPKVAALVELAGDVQGKVIVWARFRAEIAAAARALREAFGDDAVVEFHGGVDEDGRVRARTAFQDPQSAVRFFVGQTETGGLGINLDQARTVAYLSNGFSLESRLQSEDRASSAAQKHSVAVVDIIAKDTVDEKVVGALRSKRDVSRVVTGDTWKEWI